MSETALPRVMLVQTQAENAGAQEISRLLAADLLARGFDVRQVFFFRRTASFDDSPNIEFCANTRPSKPIALLAFLSRLYRMIRRIRPDVVIAFQHYGNVIAAPVARIAGAKRIIANQVSADAMIPRVLLAVDKLLGSFGLYDRIVVNSDYTAQLYGAYPAGYRDRIVRIDHGFEDKTVSISKASARETLRLPCGVPLLGCAARLHPLKQIDVAIGVLPLIQGAHLALAGQGQDRERLAAIARNLGVADRVHFLGELPPEEIGVFLAALDCFVFPSGAETFGLAPVEAAQSGLPVVANDLDVLKKVLAVDGAPCAIFADARDVEAFAAAVKTVLTDRTMAAALAAKGRRLKERYPLTAMTEAYRRLVGELTAREQC
jgi:L-malate glycosyltransferase